MQEKSAEVIKKINELQQQIDALGTKIDSLLPQIDKRIERWTWERYVRIRRNINGQGWNLLYTMNPETVKPVHTDTEYGIDFFMEIRYGSVQSAEAILGCVFKYLPHGSVVDFGCGTGTWLWMAKAFGTKKVLGVDGIWVPRNLLMIDGREFLPADLETDVSVPGKFDLAISVECAEHLSPKAADGFVTSLCNASNIVLFSAAHPGQGGDHHVNEQPMTYWEEKFQQHDFLPVQIRQLLPQNDSRILWWYRDNIILFTKRNIHDRIAKKFDSGDSGR